MLLDITIINPKACATGERSFTTIEMPLAMRHRHPGAGAITSAAPHDRLLAEQTS